MAVSAAFAPGVLPTWSFQSCRSSVVEHPLGKGEVECSIHSGSTMKPAEINVFLTAGFCVSAVCWQNNTQTSRFESWKIRGLRFRREHRMNVYSSTLRGESSFT